MKMLKCLHGKALFLKSNIKISAQPAQTFSVIETLRTCWRELTNSSYDELYYASTVAGASAPPLYALNLFSVWPCGKQNQAEINKRKESKTNEGQ